MKIDVFRRNLQRSYLDLLNERLNGRQAASDDARSIMRFELKTLDPALAAAVGRAGDRETRLHLADARDQIAKILDPKFAVRAAASATAGRPALTDEWPEGLNSCWPDYIIRRPKGGQTPERPWNGVSGCRGGHASSPTSARVRSGGARPGHRLTPRR